MKHTLYCPKCPTHKHRLVLTDKRNIRLASMDEDVRPEAVICVIKCPKCKSQIREVDTDIEGNYVAA